MLWLLLACTAPPDDPLPPIHRGTAPSGDTAVGPTAATDPSGATAHTGSDPADLPLLPEAFDCEVPEVRDSPAPTPGLLHRVTLPDVVCNDGTPAVAYIRAALDPARAADWVVQLDGGAFCEDGPTCAARWCGDGAYDATDMSSAFGSGTRRLGGLASSGPSNAFAGWNQVYVPYCTSDMWMGQRRDAPLESGGVAYRAHFEGAFVVDAVFAGLEAGMVSDDGGEGLPPGAGAAQLLFAGASAGGMGVLVHLDAVAERLAPVPVTGLVDALWSPEPLDVAAAGASDPAFDPGYVDAMDLYRQGLYDGAVVDLYQGRVEASCAASDELPYLCVDPGVLQARHVMTPFAMHHDLQDPVLAQIHLARGATFGAYEAAGGVGLEALASLRPDVGVLGSACRKHTVLGSTAWFQTMAVETVSTHDLAAAQMAGAPQVAIDPLQPTSTSTCP